ncbi:glutamate racemase [Alloalcanivorax mobilis]|mgnify:FL=1|uniref:glutamate racemase n=1 Tax=Alloalcanivorax mobilis TaxID=2019569 RepID=UPI000B5B1F3B|nr:glutamate racemase [Alloalcanivorax mobilis]ASK33170.1 glutamate racemase [Alcanivorax sp. N3-2A]ASK36988.1 glutamate racemase [Alcanivorax sp. N3-2A]
MNPPILIFDSGVGGLSVVRALRAQLPGAALAYVFDNAALPYGTKPDDWLVARIVAVCEAAVAASSARALVVACNTASTLALDALRQRLTVPVVGTVPAIKPAAALSRSGVIGLLATSATVCRPYTDRLIDQFAAGHTVVRVAADALVAQAERLIAGESLDPSVLDAGLAPLWAHPRLDTVVLGCTHFPLLKEALAARAPRPVQWVDSGDAIARRVAQVIGELNGQGHDDPQPVWSTATVSAGLVAGLARYGFPAPLRLSLEDG